MSVMRVINHVEQSITSSHGAPGKPVTRGLLALFGALFAVLGHAASAGIPPTVAPYKSVCVGEHSTGFNWEGKKWVQRTFKLPTYLVEMVDPAKYIGKPLSGTFAQCQGAARVPSEAEAFGNHEFWTKGCYLIRKSDWPKGMKVASMCDEFLKDGRIEHVACSFEGFRFIPDGEFAATPRNVDLGDHPMGHPEYRDPLVITVGKCSLLEDLQ